MAVELSAAAVSPQLVDGSRGTTQVIEQGPAVDEAGAHRPWVAPCFIQPNSGSGSLPAGGGRASAGAGESRRGGSRAAQRHRGSPPATTRSRPPAGRSPDPGDLHAPRAPLELPALTAVFRGVDQSSPSRSGRHALARAVASLPVTGSRRTPTGGQVDAQPLRGLGQPGHVPPRAPERVADTPPALGRRQVAGHGSAPPGRRSRATRYGSIQAAKASGRRS